MSYPTYRNSYYPDESTDRGTHCVTRPDKRANKSTDGIAHSVTRPIPTTVGGAFPCAINFACAVYFTPAVSCAVGSAFARTNELPCTDCLAATHYGAFTVNCCSRRRLVYFFPTL